MSIDWHKEIVIDEKIINKIRQIIDVLFLIVLAVFLAKKVFESSMLLPELEFDFYYEINKIIIWIIILKIIFSWKEYKKVLPIILVSGVLVHLMYIVNEYEFQFYVWMLAIGAYNIPYKKIVKIFFWIIVTVLLLAGIAACTSIVLNLIFVKESKLRYSFGMCYPTDYAAYVLFATFYGWIAYGKGKEKIMCFIFVIEALFFYKFCVAECSTIVALMAAVMTLYIYWCDSTVEKYNAFKNLVWLCEKYAYIICATLIIPISLVYNSNNRFLAWVDSTLSGRLTLAKEVYDTYGIHAFGKFFRLYGFGGSEVFVYDKYLFVDSSYCLILLRYGWVMLVALAVLYICIIKKARNNGDEIMVSVLALVAVHSIIEHRFPYVDYNVFLLIWLCSFDNQKCLKKDENELKSYEKKYSMLALAIYLLVLILGFVKGISIIRTMVGIRFRAFTHKENAYIIYALVIIMGIGLVIYGLCSAKRRNKRISLIVGLALNMCVVIYTASVLKYEYKLLDNYLEEHLDEKDIIQKAYEFGCSVYVDDIPDFYRHKGYDIEDKLFLANGLAEKKNVLFITTTGCEYHRLLNSGYAYIALDDYRAVYTDSMDLIYELVDKGYKSVRMFDYEKKRYDEYRNR